MRHLRSLLIPALAAAILGSTGPDARSADYTWASPVSGGWGMSLNWTPTGGPVSAADNAIFDNYAVENYTVTLDESLTINDVAVYTSPTQMVTLSTGNHVLSGNHFGALGNFRLEATGTGGLSFTTLSAGLVWLDGGRIAVSNPASIDYLFGTGSVLGKVNIGTLENLDGTLSAGDASSTEGVTVGTIRAGHNVTLLDLDLADVTNATFAGGNITAANGVRFSGAGEINGSGTLFGEVRFEGNHEISNHLTVDGPVHIDGGTDARVLIHDRLAASNVITVDGRLDVANGATVSGDIMGGGGQIFAENATLGNSLTATGFEFNGNLVVKGLVELQDFDSARPGSTTLLSGDGAVLKAQNGIRLDAGDVINGAGLVIGGLSGDNAAAGIQGTTAAILRDDIQTGGLDVTIVSQGLSTLAAALTLDGNTATSANGVKIASTGAIKGSGTFAGDVIGEAGSTISVGTGVSLPGGGEGGPPPMAGTLTLGRAGSYSGFSTAGTISIGQGELHLLSAGFASLGSLTSVEGGTLNAANGVYLGGGRNLVGFGVVAARIAAGAGSVIAATGDLTIGKSSAVDGFYSDGVLKTGRHTVTIEDKNQAVLGSLTEIGDETGAGELVALNGLLIGAGKNLVGYGSVTGAVTNLGYVEGIGPDGADGLAFNGLVKGNGSFEGNISFAGGYSPGNSPAITDMGNTGTTTFASTLTMEIGGLTPGPGSPTDNGYDKLIFGSGKNVIWGGALEIVFINGFVPSLGQSFDLFDFNPANATGAFLFDPEIGGGLWWDISQLYTSGVITVVPEPSTLALLAGGMMVVYFRRRKA